MSKGIFLVANHNSQWMCENLIQSIRTAGCELPIRLIHFGGKPVDSAYILSEVEFLQHDAFPDDAKAFIANLRTVLTSCPMGFLYRFLGWFSDWDEFIYADNDIVAMCDWTRLFTYLDGADLVHADEEYITEGRFNYEKPAEIKKMFGESSLQSAITAGHIVVKRSSRMVDDFNRAVEWFRQYPDIPIKHDQALLHVASLLGNWKMVNLCKPPHNWLSSWSGDYKNSLAVIQQIQKTDTHISHIHYSGGNPMGDLPIQDLLFSRDDKMSRLKKYSSIYLSLISGYAFTVSNYKRFKRGVKRRRGKS